MKIDKRSKSGNKEQESQKVLKQKWAQLLFVIIILLLVNLSCRLPGSKEKALEPTSSGVFIKEGGELVETFEFELEFRQTKLSRPTGGMTLSTLPIEFQAVFTATGVFLTTE